MENTETKYKHITLMLDRIRFTLKQEIPLEILMNTDIEMIESMMRDRIIYFIKTDVAGKHKITEHKIHVPKNWLYHLLSNFTKKYKTKEISIKIDHKILFPEIEILNKNNPVIYKDVLIEEKY